VDEFISEPSTAHLRKTKESLDILYYNIASGFTAKIESYSYLDMIRSHEERISDLESSLKFTLKDLDFMFKEISEKLNKLDLIEDKINHLESKFEEQEEIIVVKEISFEDAKKEVEDYILGKKGETVSPLDIARDLKIPYETAHEIFLQLIEEDKLKIKEYEGD
jgi:uncharacterized coiled-coil protein SlyX